MTPLSGTQNQILRELRMRNPDADVAEVKRLMENRFRNEGKGPLLWESLEDSVRLFSPLGIDPGKAILYYRDGVWQRNGEDEVIRLVMGLLGQDGTPKEAKTIAERIRARSPEIEGVGPREFINFRNGMLNLETLELLPHSPEYKSTVQLLVDWHTAAKAPNFEAWLASTVDPDLHHVVKQVIGAALFPGSPFQVAVALIGPGGNGKGTLERTIRKMLPKHVVSSVDLAELATNRFAAADLYGATTNLCGDIQPFTIHNTAIFKKLTGEDVIRAERKFGQPFNFTSEAFLVFSGNVMPPSTDLSEGWARRWHIIPMEKPIAGPFDSTIETRMQTVEELNGIARIAVHALVEALHAHGFSEPTACRLAKEAYRRHCSSVHAFIEEALEVGVSAGDETVFETRKAISASYSRYCAETDSKREASPALYRTILQVGGDNVTERSRRIGSERQSERGFEGVRVRPEWSTAPYPW